MPFASANGMTLAYDARGDAAAPAIVLVMGLGTQMVAWPEPFCDALAARGFRVIRFDNRDIGLSSKVEAGGPVDLGQAMQRLMAGQPIEPPYTLTKDEAKRMAPAIVIPGTDLEGFTNEDWDIVTAKSEIVFARY